MKTTPEIRAQLIRLMPNIVKLKRALAATDYKTIKFAEGFISEAEFASVRQYRERLRMAIAKAEADLPPVIRQYLAELQTERIEPQVEALLRQYGV